MFHLQTLELVHWDYCQRVALPLDASIITIAGPNGSGKTTLLDAMRTLLGLRCSSPRDWRTYARHAGAQTAWLRAVVDNRPQGRQTSSRPFARRLIYTEQVTLACRIDRNGGDWQRRYCLLEGDASIEQLQATPEKDLGFMGVEAWGRVLSAAGLSPAIARVLSLEQGQTDRLCEFSPRELLRLVFDVFGDQQVPCRWTRPSSPSPAPTARARPRCWTPCARCWACAARRRATGAPTPAMPARRPPGCAPWWTTGRRAARPPAGRSRGA